MSFGSPHLKLPCGGTNTYMFTLRNCIQKFVSNSRFADKLTINKLTDVLTTRIDNKLTDMLTTRNDNKLADRLTTSIENMLADKPTPTNSAQSEEGFLLSCSAAQHFTLNIVSS